MQARGLGEVPGNPGQTGPTQPQQVVLEPTVAFEVVKQQSQQIADLVELMKSMTQLQLANSSSAGGQGQAAASSTDPEPMEVDRDTGGVRHWKAENYIPKIPLLEYQKMTTRALEISHWSQFVESLSSWLALLDDFYPKELYGAIITSIEIEQNSLEKGPAARSARFLNLLRQALGDFQRALDIVRQCEQKHFGAACGYEAFRKLHLEFGVQSRMEATSIHEAVLGFRPGKAITRPLDVYRAVEAELRKSDRNLAAYPELKLTEPEKVMLHLKCMPESCKHYVLLHGKSDTLEEILQSIKFYDSHIRLIEYDKESKGNAKALWTEETIAAFNKGKGKKGKGKGKEKGSKGSEGSQQKGKGKESQGQKGKGGKRAQSEPAKPKGKCFFCHKPGHFAKDCPDKKKNGGQGKSSDQPGPKAKAGPHTGTTMSLVADMPQFFAMGLVREFRDDEHGRLDGLLLERHGCVPHGRDVFHDQSAGQHGERVFQHEQAVFHEHLGRQEHGHDFVLAHGHDHGWRVFEHDHMHALVDPHAVDLGEHEHAAALHEQQDIDSMVVSNPMFGRLEGTVDESLRDHLWLGDSAASVHLLSQSLIDHGHVLVVDEDHHEVRCSLAFGEVLNLTRRVTVRAQFLTTEDSLVCAELRGLVTDCVHNLLSLGSLAAKGWVIGIDRTGLRVSRLQGMNPQRRFRLFTYWYQNCGWLVRRSLRLTSALVADSLVVPVGSASASSVGEHGSDDGRKREPLGVRGREGATACGGGSGGSAARSGDSASDVATSGASALSASSRSALSGGANGGGNGGRLWDWSRHDLCSGSRDGYRGCESSTAPVGPLERHGVRTRGRREPGRVRFGESSGDAGAGNSSRDPAASSSCESHAQEGREQEDAEADSTAAAATGIGRQDPSYKVNFEQSGGGDADLVGIKSKCGVE